MRPYTSHFNFSSQSWINFLILGLVFFLLTACGGGGAEENPDATPPPPVAQTVCSELCRNQGQCGNNADGQPVVLGRDDQPSTRDPNQLFPHEASVNKLNMQEKIVRNPVTTIEENWQFFQVQMVDSGQIGWVAGICVVDQ